MATNDIWFPFYIADYVRDTQTLNTEQHGAYFLLLLCFWVEGGTMPDNDAQFATVCKSSVENWTKNLRPAIAKLFQLKNGFWSHKRVKIELRKCAAIRRKRSESGKLGGRPVKQTESKTKANGKAKVKQTESISQSHTQSQSHPESETQPQAQTQNPNSTPQANPPAVVPAGAGEHGAFIKGWCENFKSEFGTDYAVQGAKDGTATRDLLRLGIQRIDLLEIAKLAWRQKPHTFETRQSVTIAGFKQVFNQIKIQLAGKMTNRPSPESSQLAEKIIVKTL